jgi:hypothetical protein
MGPGQKRSRLVGRARPHRFRSSELYASANGIAGSPVHIEPSARTAHPDAGAAARLRAEIAEQAGVESPLAASEVVRPR